MTNRSRWLRAVVTCSMIAALGACGAAVDPQGSTQTLKTTMASSGDGERAMAALSRGDAPAAEKLALAALRKNPKDPHALLVAGLAHQATGRFESARQYYEVIVSNNLDGVTTAQGENGSLVTRPIVDVARANLDMVNKVTGRVTTGTAAESGRRSSGLEPAWAGVADAEASVAGRFRILKRLAEDSLITPEEYSARRNANIGALLPLSSSPPAANLERPVPSDAQVVDRLRALKVAVEAREISPREQAEERSAILDALLPAQPRVRAFPPLPPRDMLESGQAVGRIERFRAAGLISADEAGREKAAVDRAFSSQLATRPVEGTATGLRYGPAPGTSSVTPVKTQALPAETSWGVSLALAKSDEAARADWERIKVKFPEDLGGKELAVKKVELKGRGTRWRVVAGPMESRAAAAKLCKTLKLHRQACDPASFGS